MMNRPRAGEPTSIQKHGAAARVLAALLSSVQREPPRAPRPKLSRSLLGRTSTDIDWRLTIIAAVSFLAHFGAVGSVYSDWLDPLVDDGPTVEGLIDALKIVPAPFDALPVPSAQATVFVSTAPSEQHGGPSAPPATRAAPRAGAGSGDRARLLAEAANREMAIISALGGSGTSRNALRDGQAVTQLLDGVAAERQGITTEGSSGLHLGGSGDLVTPGISGALSVVGETTRGVPGGAGSSGPVKAPSGVIKVDPLPITTGNIPHADRTVAGLKAAYRRCYMRGLDAMPDAEGSVELRVRIGPNGEVGLVSTSGGAKLGSEIVTCLVRRTSEARFEEPQGGSATVVIPITFALQR